MLPFEQIDENVEILPGLDGRKMSKSYNNVIPLFEGGEKALREAIGRIVTDSKLPGEPKDPQSTSLTRIYEAFATREDYEAFCQELRDGLGWGDAKKKLIDKSMPKSVRCAKSTNTTFRTRPNSKPFCRQEPPRLAKSPHLSSKNAPRRRPAQLHATARRRAES